MPARRHRLFEHVCRLGDIALLRVGRLLQFVLIEQIDCLLDEGCLTVFQMQAEFMQSLGVTIAYPALQPAVTLLLALHVLALAFGVLLSGAFLQFLAIVTFRHVYIVNVISHFSLASSTKVNRITTPPPS